jgi:hypothetical protein
LYAALRMIIKNVNRELVLFVRGVVRVKSIMMIRDVNRDPWADVYTLVH